MRYVVNTYEMGLLFKNNSFVKALEPGIYKTMPFSKRWVLSVNMAEKFDPGYEFSLFLKDRLLAEKLEVIKLKDNEIALHYVDGNFKDILSGGTHAYFKTLKKHSFVVLDTTNPIIPGEVDLTIMSKDYFKKDGVKYITAYSIPTGKIGILTIDGSFIKTLTSGSHYFLKGKNNVELKIVDIRKQLLEVSGQELLSGDKVTLRMNFVCQYKVVDPTLAAVEFEDYEQQLYNTLQLALREYVSTRKLDELLAKKHEIGSIILNTVKPKEEHFGVEFIEAGVKDIILPGDIKDILNTVLIAEKRAYANVITRREETASTRDLLNTAKLMDENKTLYRLKELEYIERICDKVGNISLTPNAGILEQLRQIAGDR